MDIGFLKTSFGSLSTDTAFSFLEESTASLISCFVICLFSISVSSSGGIMFFWDDIVLMKLLSKHGLLRGTPLYRDAKIPKYYTSGIYKQIVLILSRLSDSVQGRRGSYFEAQALYFSLRTS